MTTAPPNITTILIRPLSLSCLERRLLGTRGRTQLALKLELYEYM